MNKNKNKKIMWCTTIIAICLQIIKGDMFMSLLYSLMILETLSNVIVLEAYYRKKLPYKTKLVHLPFFVLLILYPLVNLEIKTVVYIWVIYSLVIHVGESINLFLKHYKIHDSIKEISNIKGTIITIIMLLVSYLIFNYQIISDLPVLIHSDWLILLVLKVFNTVGIIFYWLDQRVIQKEAIPNRIDVMGFYEFIKKYYYEMPKIPGLILIININAIYYVYILRSV